MWHLGQHTLLGIVVGLCGGLGQHTLVGIVVGLMWGLGQDTLLGIVVVGFIGGLGLHTSLGIVVCLCGPSGNTLYWVLLLVYMGASGDTLHWVLLPTRILTTHLSPPSGRSSLSIPAGECHRRLALERPRPKYSSP
jgi:hypothetical protein